MIYACLLASLCVFSIFLYLSLCRYDVAPEILARGSQHRTLVDLERCLLVHPQNNTPTNPQGADDSDDEWTSSVFNTYFELELDPCPPSVAEIYGTPEGGIVPVEEVQSPDCGGGDGEERWLAFEASCYSKSSFLDVALDWEDADARFERTEQETDALYTLL